MRSFVLVSSLVIFGLVIASCKGLDQPESFVEVDSDWKRVHRNLLQSEAAEGPQEADDEGDQETYKGRGGLSRGTPKLGPRQFYDGKDFLMEVAAPIRVSIFSSDGANRLSSVDLDGAAKSIVGSLIDANTFKVNLDWKSQSFGNNLKITSIQINMYFKKQGGEYVMDKLNVVHLIIDGKQMIDNPLKVKTKNGYEVAAPLGAAFGCYDPGMFPPIITAQSNDYRVGLTFPYLRLQVFELSSGNRFGPEWACDNFMTIGVWVGLLVSLLFALVCYWGFSMLASIQTMDRFDDPRGKSIHVPQTD